MCEASGSSASNMGTIQREIRNSNNVNTTSPSSNLHNATETSIYNEGHNVTPHTNDVDGQIFTVERNERKHTKHYKRKKTFCLSAFKSLLSILISLVLFACVVASKLSLVHIGQKLNYTEITASNSSSRVRSQNGSKRETSLIMLIMILVSPSVYTFLRAICISGMKRSHPWPTRNAVIWVGILTLMLCILFLGKAVRKTVLGTETQITITGVVKDIDWYFACSNVRCSNSSIPLKYLMHCNWGRDIQ